METFRTKPFDGASISFKHAPNIPCAVNYSRRQRSCREDSPLGSIITKFRSLLDNHRSSITRRNARARARARQENTYPFNPLITRHNGLLRLIPGSKVGDYLFRLVFLARTEVFTLRPLYTLRCINRPPFLLPARATFEQLISIIDSAASANERIC